MIGYLEVDIISERAVTRLKSKADFEPIPLYYSISLVIYFTNNMGL